MVEVFIIPCYNYLDKSEFDDLIHSDFLNPTLFAICVVQFCVIHNV